MTQTMISIQTSNGFLKVSMIVVNLLLSLHKDFSLMIPIFITGDQCISLLMTINLKHLPLIGKMKSIFQRKSYSKSLESISCLKLKTQSDLLKESKKLTKKEFMLIL
jgi:hypothetical protein